MSKVSKTVLYILLFLIIVWFIYSVRKILLPFILSALLTYIITPLIGYFESFGIKRSIIVICLYIFCLIIFVGTIVIFVPAIIKEVSVLTEKLPEYTTLLKTYIGNLQQTVETKFPIVKQKGFIDTWILKINEYFNKELTKIPEYLMNLFSLFSLLVLIPFITYFLLTDSRKMFDKLFEWIPTRYVETVLSFVCEFDEAVGTFLRLQFIEASLVGLLSIIGLLILHINYAVLIGIIAGLGNLIPYLGPVIGAVPAVIVGLIQYSDPNIILKIAILFFIVQFVDNNFIQPFLMSKGISLNPVVIIFAVMAGAQIAGVLGMFFAVPAASVVKVTINILKRQLHSSGW